MSSADPSPSTGWTVADPGRPAKLGDLLGHVPFPVLLVDPAGVVVDHNDVVPPALGLDQDVRGEPAPALFREPGVVQELLASAERGDFVGDGADAVVPGPGQTFLEVSAVPTQIGEERFVLVMLWDATARLGVEAERDRYSGHVSLLGRVSEALLGAHDPDEALRALGSELVGSFAEWVSFQAYDGRGVTARVLVEHRDPERADDVARAIQLLPTGVTDETPSRRIARGEGAMLLEHISEELLEQTTRDPETRDVLRRLGVASALVVPLTGSRGVLGSMAVFRGDGEPAFTPAELTVATEVGRRTGAAFEVLEANRRQRVMAEQLQRSMLTDPPVLATAELVARYVPAADEAQVGGDWYDSFIRRDGTLLLTVGDVVGHDFRAAAVMGQLRGVLRGIGFGHVGGPGTALELLDAATEALYPGVTATALVGTLSRPHRDTVLRWSSAGHPPPVVVRADGETGVCDLDGTDLLLGVIPGSVRREHELVLHPGDTVLFFSDGLIERRGRDLDVGIQHLVTTARELAGLDLADLCDEVLARLVGDAQEDDVCLIGVRVRP